jgi:glycosyltransferase involved in cell wall biosynthesis
MLPPAIIRMGFRAYLSYFNIAYWAWELDTLPAEWVRALRYVNAIFAPSTFTAHAVAQHTTKPVVVVPHPVVVGAATNGIRARLRLPANSFMVVTIFSFGSSVERKNPQGAIEAFRQAFSFTEQAHLIIKTTHGSNYPSDLASLKSFIGDTPNIFLVDEIWGSEEISGLISEANAYISLHRSEGFGLTIAEAILRRTPVIATNWSGNTDFCCPHSTSLIGFELVAAQSNDTVSAFHGGHWAAPSVDEAAKALRFIFEDKEQAHTKAEDAKTYAENYFKNHTYRDGLSKLHELA